MSGKARKLSDIGGERVTFPVQSAIGECDGCNRPGSNKPWAERTDDDYGPLIVCDCKAKLHSQVCYSGHRHEVDYRPPTNRLPWRQRRSSRNHY